MGNWFAWLLAAAWPLVKKVLLMLGVGWLTYEGVTLVVGQIQGQVTGLWGGLPTATLQLMALGGYTQGVGILLGALAGRAALVSIGKLGKVA